MTGLGHHLKVLPLALALGITSGLGLLILSWVNWWSTGGWGSQFMQVVSSVYLGYKPGFWGGIVGFIWGFVIWFIGGLVLAWIYNGCARCCKKCETCA